MNDTVQHARYFHFRKEPASGSRCKTVGHAVVEPNAVYPLRPEQHPRQYHNVQVCRSLDGFHLVYVVSGSGWFVNDSGERFPVKAGTVLPIFPHAPHAYSPDPGTGWVEYWVGCDGSYPKWLIKENAFRFGQQPIPLGPDREVMEDFRQLCQTSDAERLGGLINRLVCRIVVLQHDKPFPFYNEATGIVERVTSYLESRLNADISQKELSDLCGLSYRRLSQLFKEATGLPPHQYFLDRKIKLAIRMLESGESVSSVSEQLGFDSPYYFSRLFRQKVGRAPSLFKQS